MDRRSRSISPRRNRNGGSSRREHRRSRSRSRDRYRSSEKDLYRDLIYDDYQDGYSGRKTRNRDDDYNEDRSYAERNRDYDRKQRDRDHERDWERSERSQRSKRHRDYDSDESEASYINQSYNKTPSNTLIILGLNKNITETDILSVLIQMNVAAKGIRLIRKRDTGTSRGFAFVEFTTVEEAVQWMELTQGSILIRDHCRAIIQYSQARDSVAKASDGAKVASWTDTSGEPQKLKPYASDWYCGKCGGFNFTRRESCFKCNASRKESETGGEGSDEISNILTKKIMLRNLDALTNEESILTAIQQYVPDHAKRITKILVCRDPLTHTSRGFCYLNFESLVDSMNVHSALTSLDPPFEIDNRQVVITYCIDHENRQILPKKTTENVKMPTTPVIGPLTAAEMAAQSTATQYTLTDVPRLAHYSASMYATTPAEYANYLKYYTDLYISEINKGQYKNLPTDAQLTELSANSGAAVALSAIQRKQKKMNAIETTATHAASTAAAAAAKATIAAQNIVTPRGNDGKTYPIPDVSMYQYDESSGFYYDPTTGLYYDAHSQYYYNSETGVYLYWDQRKSTYVLATPASVQATVQDTVQAAAAKTDPHRLSGAQAAVTLDDDVKKDKKENPKQDKVKVAKKIVKDMEKWAKQLNQKKDYTVVETPQPILTTKSDEIPTRTTTNIGGLKSGYADVGFSILEKKKLSDYVAPTPGGANKLLNTCGSDSDEEHPGPSTSTNSALRNAATASTSGGGNAGSGGKSDSTSERDYIDFQKLTCLLCKRAFQSLEILQKHLKMSTLHKENLQKHNLIAMANETDHSGGLTYRDRAKERRLKYGESDPPPPNRSRERFETEIKSLQSRQPEKKSAPIDSNNVGSRLLQKMGWNEGQGLGRQNQGRTNIIEAESRAGTVGLGNRSGIAPGDDYKSYIKKMMKSRYESV